MALIEAFSAGAWGELDYEQEAANQRTMARALEGAPSRALRDRVYVPEVRAATRKALVTDWVEGDQLVRASPETIAALVPLGVECFCWQLLGPAWTSGGYSPRRASRKRLARASRNFTGWSSARTTATRIRAICSWTRRAGSL